MRSKLIALAGATLFLAGACGDDGSSGYSDETRNEFVSQCTAGAGDSARDMCECSYEAITDNMSFEEFERYDEALSDDPSAEIPAEVTDAMTECATASLDLPTPSTP